MNKLDKVVKDLEDDVKDLEAGLADRIDDLDDQKKQKATELVDKTKALIKVSIDKIAAVYEEIKEDQKIDEFLDKIKAKAKEAVDYTMDKIDALKNQDTTTIDCLSNELVNGFESLKESDIYKKTQVLLKEGAIKVNDFINRPDVQEAIKKAKITTVKYAEKGVDGLKQILKVEDTKKPATKKAPAKKTATKKATTKSTKKTATTTKKKTTKKAA